MGATYYVAANGDDTHQGTSPELAWSTLERASSHPFEEGDVLLLEGGHNHTGSLTLTNGPPIRISNFGDERAKIIAGEKWAIKVINRSIAIENIEALGSWNSETQSGNAADGFLIGCNFASEKKVNGVQLKNLVARGFRDSGIHVVGGGPDKERSGFEDVVIEDCIAHDNGHTGIQVSGVYDMETSGWCHRNVTVRNCKAHHNLGHVGGSNHSGNGIVMSDVQGGLIERCVAFSNGELNDFIGGGPVGIWTWDSDSVVIQQCISYKNRTKTKDGGGFDIDGGCTNCVLQYNYSYENAGSGFMHCQFEGARPFFKNVIRFNVSIHDNWRNGGGTVIYDGWDGVVDCDVYHNTYVSSPSTCGWETPSPLRCLTGTKHTRILNNIFYCYGDIPVAEIAEGQDDFVCTHNVFFNPDGIWFDLCGERVTDQVKFEQAVRGENIFKDPDILTEALQITSPDDLSELERYWPWKCEIALSLDWIATETDVLASGLLFCGAVQH